MSNIREDSSQGSWLLHLLRNKANAIGKGQAMKTCIFFTLNTSAYHVHLISKGQSTTASSETFG